jgi:hypothetical protein
MPTTQSARESDSQRLLLLTAACRHEIAPAVLLDESAANGRAAQRYATDLDDLVYLI